MFRTLGRAALVGKALTLSVALLAVPTRAADEAAPATSDRPTVIVIVGAPGEEEFGKTFAQSSALWEKAARQGGAKLITLGLASEGNATDREQVEQTLRDEPKEGRAELWLVLLGHGTFDGKEAKFNLRGPDLGASAFAKWLEPFRRPLAIINTASASAPFLKVLSATNRVVISATRSGAEQNFARLGQYLADAIADPDADLDKDGQTSLLEAWLVAARRTKEFYQGEGRLATEHPLLDDNGDGLGTPADWFRGLRAVKKAKDGAAMDGVRAHQFHLVRSNAEQQLPPDVRARRDQLEQAVSRLREQKSQLGEEEYYRRLETLLVELARLYEGAKFE